MANSHCHNVCIIFSNFCVICFPSLYNWSDQWFFLFSFSNIWLLLLNVYNFYQVTSLRINFITDNIGNYTAVGNTEGKDELRNDSKVHSWLMSSFRHIYTRRWNNDIACLLISFVEAYLNDIACFLFSFVEAYHNLVLFFPLLFF